METAVPQEEEEAICQKLSLITDELEVEQNFQLDSMGLYSCDFF